MDFDAIMKVASENFTNFGMKILGAIVVWVVGRWLIGLSTRLLSAALDRQKVDPTLIRYVVSVINVSLTIILVVAILGYFGVETTSFAALIAAAGVAIGAAWAGLLSNFAAGAFLLILRPFKVGDEIKAGGIEGKVTELGLFSTTVLTGDNVVSFVGNNKIFSDTIQNLSASHNRRVDRTVQLDVTVDATDAVRRLKEAVSKVPNVLATPAPDVQIFDVNTTGPVIAVRPYAKNEHYWQVYFDTNRAIIDTCKAAGYPVPGTGVVAGPAV